MVVPTSQFSPPWPGTWPQDVPTKPSPRAYFFFNACAGSRRLTFDDDKKELVPSRSTKALSGVVTRVSKCEHSQTPKGACMFALALV